MDPCNFALFSKSSGNFPQLDGLTDEEKVPHLMKILSRFVCRNLPIPHVDADNKEYDIYCMSC